MTSPRPQLTILSAKEVKEWFYGGMSSDTDSSANQNSPNVLELAMTVQLCGASCAQQSCHTERLRECTTDVCHAQAVRQIFIYNWWYSRISKQTWKCCLPLNLPARHGTLIFLIYISTRGVCVCLPAVPVHRDGKRYFWNGFSSYMWVLACVAALWVFLILWIPVRTLGRFMQFWWSLLD